MLKREPSKESTAPEVRFKVQAKRRAAAWQTVLRTVELIRQDAPKLNEWRKKLSEIDSFRRISADLAQKLQQSRADALLDNQTRRNEISQLQQKISVLSADLASSRDSGTKTDEKIAKLATKLAKSEASKIESAKILETMKKTISPKTSVWEIPTGSYADKPKALGPTFSHSSFPHISGHYRLLCRTLLDASATCLMHRLWNVPSAVVTSWTAASRITSNGV